jgi:predicted transglutaminase-like cysteine proteinase
MTRLIHACVALALLTACTTVTEIPAAKPTVGGEVSPPYGFVGYCLRAQADCSGGTDAPKPITMTPDRWAELNAVNAFVNHLPQVEDIERYHVLEYWTVADDKGGDCEDLALRKRAELIARGWPADELLMTTVREADGDAHAVLTVVTTEGDFILDNKAWAIVREEAAPYVFLKRQSAYRPWVWLDMQGGTVATVYYAPLGSEAPFITVVEKASNNVGGIRK